MLVLCLAPVAAHAAVMAFWNPAGTIQSDTPLAPSAVAPGIAAGNLALGPGITNPGAFANAFVGTGWPAGALSTSDYMSFSVTGNVTYQSVVFSLYNNFDGTGNWELRSSADSFAAALASGTFSTISGGGELISADVSSLGTRNGTVEFRLYTFNNAGTTDPLQRGIRGTAALGQGLTVNGTVAGVVITPEVAPLLVPTLSQAMLLALLAMIGLAGVAVVRKRKA